MVENDLAKLARKHKIPNQQSLERIIEKAAGSYANSQFTEERITHKDMEALRRFEKSATRTQRIWKSMPPMSRGLAAYMAHLNASPLADDSMVELEGTFMEVVDTDKIEQKIEQQLHNIWNVAFNASGGFIGSSKSKNQGLIEFLGVLKEYWEGVLGRKATFTHDSSKFENFASDVLDAIALDQTKYIHGVWRSMQGRERFTPK